MDSEGLIEAEKERQAERAQLYKDCKKFESRLDVILTELHNLLFTRAYSEKLDNAIDNMRAEMSSFVQTTYEWQMEYTE